MRWNFFPGFNIYMEWREIEKKKEDWVEEMIYQLQVLKKLACPGWPMAWTMPCELEAYAVRLTLGEPRYDLFTGCATSYNLGHTSFFNLMCPRAYLCVGVKGCSTWPNGLIWDHWRWCNIIPDFKVVLRPANSIIWDHWLVFFFFFFFNKKFLCKLADRLGPGLAHIKDELRPVPKLPKSKQVVLYYQRVGSTEPELSWVGSTQARLSRASCFEHLYCQCNKYLLLLNI